MSSARGAEAKIAVFKRKIWQLPMESDASILITRWSKLRRLDNWTLLIYAKKCG